MPGFRDFVAVLRGHRAVDAGFFRRLWRKSRDDRLTVWASALAHSYLFAFFALLLLLITLTPYLPIDHQQFLNRLREALTNMMPPSAATTVAESFEHVVGSRKSGVLSLGILLSLWTTGRGMATTMSAMNHLLGVERDRPFYQQRPIAIALTLTLALLAVALLLLMPFGSALVHSAVEDSWLPSWPAQLGTIARWAIRAALLWVGVSIVYYFAPRTRPAGYRFFTPGAVLAVAGWLLVAVGLHFYLGRFAQPTEVYGAVGGVLVLLLVFYLDAYALLLGAQLNAVVLELTGQQTPPGD